MHNIVLDCKSFNILRISYASDILTTKIRMLNIIAMIVIYDC